MTFTSVFKSPAVCVQLQSNLPPLLRFASATQRPFELQCPQWLARQLRNWLEPTTKQPPFFPNIYQSDKWKHSTFTQWCMERDDLHVSLFRMTPEKTLYSLIPVSTMRAALESMPPERPLYVPDDDMTRGISA